MIVPNANAAANIGSVILNYISENTMLHNDNKNYAKEKVSNIYLDNLTFIYEAQFLLISASYKFNGKIISWFYLRLILNFALKLTYYFNLKYKLIIPFQAII